MHHHVARARSHRLLFSSWAEAARLWAALHHAVPGTVACCLMPDHLHLLHPAADLRRRLGPVFSGYTRWRNGRHGQSGSMLEPMPIGQAIPGNKKLRRNLRYVHLNPCRARLVADPLAWPFSTHRDALGLVVSPVRAPSNTPEALHAYVSRDEWVDGSPMPAEQIEPHLTDVWVATSAAIRVPEAALRRRGPGRTLFLRAARVLTDASLRQIGAVAGVSPNAVHKTVPTRSRAVRVVARVAGDPRFHALDGQDLRRLPGWRRYRSRG